MIKWNISLLTICTLLLISSCGNDEHPAEQYIEREGPLQHSDSLAQVAVRMLERIDDLPLTGDRDVNIARKMIEHHRATIEMNDILIRDGVDQDLKSFAQRLSEAHQREVAIMQQFLDDHPEVPDAGQRGSPDMMKGLHHVQPTDDIQAAYIDIMTIHLHDGRELAQQQVDRGLHDEIKHLTRAMISNADAHLEELGKIASDIR